jgi:two-component system, cell cycle response regulator
MGVDAPRVLIADGDTALRQQLYAALLGLDVFSDTVGTTAEALARLAEEQYRVVVLDVALQPGDVERVIAAIAAMPAGERPVVLVLAGNPDAARSLDVEIVQIVLRRPVNFPQLVDLVRSCVRDSRGRGAAAARGNGDALRS